MQNENTELLKEFQKSWATKKYWVMARSQQAYNHIRLLAKGNQWTTEKQQQYESLLVDLEQVRPTEKTLRVTYQHLWGYFKKVATEKEKQRYLQLIEAPHLEGIVLETFLKELSQKYQQAYLQKMTWCLTDENETGVRKVLQKNKPPL
ncbi:YbgA family protein [Enterococcus sp. LJL98]